jgi:hypothetical protein
MEQFGGKETRTNLAHSLRQAYANKAVVACATSLASLRDFWLVKREHLPDVIFLMDSAIFWPPFSMDGGEILRDFLRMRLKQEVLAGCHCFMLGRCTLDFPLATGREEVPGYADPRMAGIPGYKEPRFVAFRNFTASTFGADHAWTPVRGSNPGV